MRKTKKKTVPKVRRVWKIHPATRVEPDVRKYNRKTQKRELKKMIDEP